MKKKHPFLAIILVFVLLLNSIQIRAVSTDSPTMFNEEIVLVSRDRNQNIYVYKVHPGTSYEYCITVNLTENSVVVLSSNNKSQYSVQDVICGNMVEPNHRIDTSLLSIPRRDTVYDNRLSSVQSVDYIDNEPLEINETTGVQKSLNVGYILGYEPMGSRGFTNPTEYAFLMRKNSGYSIVYAHNFSISPGTLVSAAVSVITSLLLANGVSVAAAVVASLLTTLLGISVDAIISYTVGATFACREYRWDYRVAHNSYIGSVLFTTYKTRYWWEMHDSNGNLSLQARPNIMDGWALSNQEMLAHALGRS